MQNAFANLPLPHFFRWLIFTTVMEFAFLAFVVPGLIWSATVMEKTGYQKIDVLWIFVPVASLVVFTRTQWRYCARAAYWAPASVPAAAAAAA